MVRAGHSNQGREVGYHPGLKACLGFEPLTTWIPTRRSHGMSVARTLSGNTVFSCVTNPFTFNKLEAGGVERYAPTDNTQLIEKVRTQEPHNPLYARLLCTKSCTTKSVAAELLTFICTSVFERNFSRTESTWFIVSPYGIFLIARRPWLH